MKYYELNLHIVALRYKNSINAFKIWALVERWENEVIHFRTSVLVLFLCATI